MVNRSELEEPLVGDTATPKKKQLSRNVYVTYLLLFVWGLADSIWSGAILSAWLFLLAGGQPDNDLLTASYNSFVQMVPNVFYTTSYEFGNEFFEEGNSSKAQSADANTVVGGVEALQGLASLLTALPIGYLADKYGRSPMCKIGGVGFIAAAALTLMALNRNYDEHTEVVLLGVALALWGTFGGIFSGPLQALFADSVPQGERSYYYTVLQVCYMTPSIVGPILAIILFQKYGDHWTYDELRLPFKIGVCLEFPAAVLAFFLRDDLALDEPEPTKPTNQEEDNEGEGNEEADNSWSRKRESYIMPVLGVKLTRASIPYVLFCSDLLYSLGSGMTIKFFPLFFMKEVGMAPSGVQLVRILATIILMCFSFVAQSISKKLGRVQVVTMCRGSGICLMVVLALLVHHGVSQWYIVIPVYLIRTGLMNCAYPLDESILMDNVKKSERSRWKSLESVSVFGWCGSAFLGGILADAYSYDFSFLITALLQGTGAITYLLLVPLVLDEKTADEPTDKRVSSLFETSEILGSPHRTAREIEEELIRPLQQSP